MTCYAAKCDPTPEWRSTDDRWEIEDRGVSEFLRVPKPYGLRPYWPWHAYASPKLEYATGLVSTIQASYAITELGDNWDDGGSPGYARETLAKAVAFLTKTVGWSTPLPLPQINPADGGSIDLYWRDTSRYLLINFPPGNGNPSYYGEDSFGSTMGGVIKTDSAGRQVLDWLIRAGR